MHTMNEELLDLLTARALGELAPDEERRLAELLATSGLASEESIDLAVAAAMNAFALREPREGSASVPEALNRKLHDDAHRHFDAPEVAASSETVIDFDRGRARREASVSESRPPRSLFGAIGWAIAATLAIVVIVTQPEFSQPAPDLATARSLLLAEADTTVIEWNRPDIPAYNGVRGDVVWNGARQEGYLRLSGMPTNDPSIAQYQLWIVDPGRDANPVDGGVFDIPDGGEEVIIRIDAKLAVAAPAAFAITREQPGGVVVSDGPLLVVAAAG